MQKRILLVDDEPSLRRSLSLGLNQNGIDVELCENGMNALKKIDLYQKNKVLVIVEDNGCGMDESVMRNIFDPFFTTKRNSGGTGLGLSITYGIIKDHNGSIDVESKIVKGTTFTLRFPVKFGD